MSDIKLTKNQLRRQRLQKNKTQNIENNSGCKNYEEYELKLNSIKNEIETLENNNIKIPKTGKNGQLELVYSPEVLTKLNKLKKELQELKKTKYQDVKNNIVQHENEMFAIALKEMQEIKSKMNEFSQSSATVLDTNDTDSKSEQPDVLDVEFTGFNKAKKRRNSTSSSSSSGSLSSSGSATNSYSGDSVTLYNSASNSASTASNSASNSAANKMQDKIPSEKEVIEAATKMWDAVKTYVKNNPKFRELQDKQKLEIFRDRLGFAKFMEEFPIVSRYMVCMGQFKLKAFQRLLDKMKRTKYPPPEERDKKYMEDQWIKWQADYVQYLWEEYQKRHYNTAERQWVWQETYKRLKGEFDDFRKMHEDIEEKVKQEKATLSGKNARDLLERLKTGAQKLNPDDEEQLLQSLLDISYKKNYKTTLQQLLKNTETTEDKYEHNNKVYEVLMPCCGRLIDRNKLQPLFNNLSFNKPIIPLAYKTISEDISYSSDRYIKCPGCSSNIINFNIETCGFYYPVFRSVGKGENIDKQPKISMIETVDVNRMGEINDSYKMTEHRGMEPILEEYEVDENNEVKEEVKE